MIKKLPLILILFLAFLANNLWAQMQVSGIPMTIPGGPSSYNAMVQQLLGTGVTISNITLNCNTSLLQAGWFTAAGTNLGLTQGMLLTSGDINGGPGPNSLANYTGSVQSGLGDADLNNQVVGFTTNDACIIEFDIVPYCDTLSIKYVFGSDEYEEFVNSIYNDVFAFFISGPNPMGGNYVTQNIALIPNTTTPVSINNVNCNLNSTYYRCNSANSTAYGGICTTANCPSSNATTSLQYDGLTKVLKAKAAVIPCQTYHIKIAVADGGGHLLDSGVFLEAGGVNCSTPTLASVVSNGVEGCQNATFTFHYPTPLQNNDTLHFQIAGTATAGLDYVASAIPANLIIPAGASSGSISIPILNDGVADGGETIQLIYADTALCGTQIVMDTFTVYILDAPTSSVGPDKVVCSGEATTIGISPSFGHIYHWTPSTGIIGGTNNSALATVLLTNNTATAYTTTYTLIDSAGTTGCLSSNTVNITVNPHPQANFNTPDACLGLISPFYNTSFPPGFTSHWDFGDANTSNLFDPTHLYAAAGNYNVQLIVTDNNGCTDTLTKVLTIYPKPIADFTANPVCLHTASIFNDNSTNATQWKWNLGGSNIFTTQNITYTYPSSGLHQATLIVTNVQGCKDTISKPVQVYALPSAKFGATSKCVYDSILFQNQSVQGSNLLNAYIWDFGDFQASSQTNPAHLYAVADTFKVSLIVIDAFGCTDTFQKKVEVYPQPNALFTVNNACQKDSVLFINHSTIATGNISSTLWHFGDNTVSTFYSPSHTYNNAGFYWVNLLVKSNHACIDTVGQQIEIYPLPKPKFSANTACLGDATYFVDNSTLNSTTQIINAWNWNFGDSISSNLQNPTHTYAQAGTYNVVFSAISDKGCKDSVKFKVNVNELPELPLIKNDSVCVNGDATLLAINPYLAKVNWYNSPTDSLPFFTGIQYIFHNLMYDVEYYVQVVGTTTGCKTPMLPISAHVYPESVQALLITDSLLFLPNAVATFSVASNVPLNAYEWNFGDKTSSQEATPSHQYDYSAQFIVNVITTDTNQCEKFLQRVIEVKEVFGVHAPSAFSPNNDGYNDVFVVGTYEINALHIEIYDRWGKIIFISDDPNFSWDGKNQAGKVCPEGVYVYKVTALSNTKKEIEQAGTITLIR